MPAINILWEASCAARLSMHNYTIPLYNMQTLFIFY